MCRGRAAPALSRAADPRRRTGNSPWPTPRSVSTGTTTCRRTTTDPPHRHRGRAVGRRARRQQGVRPASSSGRPSSPLWSPSGWRFRKWMRRRSASSMLRAPCSRMRRARAGTPAAKPATRNRNRSGGKRHADDRHRGQRDGRAPADDRPAPAVADRRGQARRGHERDADDAAHALDPRGLLRAQDGARGLHPQ